MSETARLQRLLAEELERFVGASPELPPAIFREVAESEVNHALKTPDQLREAGPAGAMLIAKLTELRRHELIPVVSRMLRSTRMAVSSHANAPKSYADQPLFSQTTSGDVRSLKVRDDNELLRPRALRKGDTIGVFTPASPGYVENLELFANGLRTLERIGFRTKLGSLTASRAHAGWRAGTAEERAAELMELVRDPDVSALIPVIGGNNSSSLVPFLNFEEIRRQRKLLCGYSDITSLHLSWHRFAGLSSVYGPTVMCWFGEWPDGDEASIAAFQNATMAGNPEQQILTPPPQWSNHSRRWENGDWQRVPRQWQKNPGWTAILSGRASGRVLAVNLNTLLTAAGTPLWPVLKDRILIVEDMEAGFAGTERKLRQLAMTGAFDEIAALIVSKPEFPDAKGSTMSYDDLVREVVGMRPWPLITNFDTGHTLPMLAIPQLVEVEVEARTQRPVSFRLLGRCVED